MIPGKGGTSPPPLYTVTLQYQFLRIGMGGIQIEEPIKERFERVLAVEVSGDFVTIRCKDSTAWRTTKNLESIDKIREGK